MFGNKEFDQDGHQVSALLEPGCSFDGKLTFQDTVRINGHFKGEIFSEGTLVVGEGAVVEARINVGSVIIDGKVIGEIEAAQRIEMHNTAEVRGNISAKTLVIEEGVLFEGQCSMGTPEPVIHRVAEEPELIGSPHGNDGDDRIAELSEGLTPL